jgi:LysM repeat protein
MLAKAKHRRFKNGPLTRGLVAMGAGGAVLALPLVASASASAATPAHVAEATPVAAPTATKAATTTYTVVSGDSLSKIAKARSVTGGWQRLYQNNRQVVGADPNLIHPGLQLKLDGPALSQTSGSAARTGSASQTAGSSASSANSGDAAGTTTAVSTKATAAAPTSTKTYADNLNGWIDQSLDVMAAHGIPGSYNGIYRNVMRESSGNPQAINNWDSNAAKGTPSKGLLQVIQPTFDSYHVAGTSMDIYDPVANITAACNYAFPVYGSIDNVNGPY